VTSRCSVADCGGEVRGFGYCNRHLHRFRRHGDPLAGGRERHRRESRVCEVQDCGGEHLAQSGRQPKGQRVDDLIEFVVEHYRDRVMEALSRESTERPALAKEGN